MISGAYAPFPRREAAGTGALAVATGQDATLDAGLCDAALAIVAAYPPEVWGDPRFFAPQVPAADGDPPHLRLVRMLGRQP